MSQTVLISDNDVINALYEINLRAYVDSDAQVHKSVDSAISDIEDFNEFSAVIYFETSSEGQEDSFEKLTQFFTDNHIGTPLIVMGNTDQSYEYATYIANRYDIKALLQSLAKTLGITAKDMAELEVAKYFAVSTRILSQIDKSVCDVFQKIEVPGEEDEFQKVIDKETEFSEILQDFKDRGFQELYIDSDYRLNFINRASGFIVNEFKRTDLSVDERIAVTQQAMSVVAEDVFANDTISDRMAKISKACIESIKQTIKDVPDLKKLLRALLENKGDVVYKHSVISTYISNELLRVISWGSDEQANKVAFALFFHDIYLVPVYRKYPNAVVEEDLLFREDVGEVEKQLVLEHAKKAGHLVKSFPRCPMGSDMVITQHHGMTSGEGFAVNFKDDISPLSKIMIISEEIAMNILLAAEDSIDKVVVDKEKMTEYLSEKFRNHTYKKIIQAFNEIDI